MTTIAVAIVGRSITIWGAKLKRSHKIIKKIKEIKSDNIAIIWAIGGHHKYFAFLVNQYHFHRLFIILMIRCILSMNANQHIN